MDEIRVGLIGFGSVASTLHVPLLRATAGYRLVAVATSRPDGGRGRAARRRAVR